MSQFYHAIYLQKTPFFLNLTWNVVQNGQEKEMKIRNGSIIAYVYYGTLGITTFSHILLVLISNEFRQFHTHFLASLL